MKHGLLVGLSSLIVFSTISNFFFMRTNHISGRSTDSISHIDTETPRVISKNKVTWKIQKKSQPRARVPNPLSLNESASFSSCLLVRDDNDILNEWIAYHYFALELRYLIVAVDPLSETSPSGILDKWRDRIEIVLWDDEASYMPHNFLVKGVPPSKKLWYGKKALKGNFGKNFTDRESIEISNHRYRQRMFLLECIETLRTSGRTWMMHIDTDEFVVVNKALRQKKPENYVDIPSMETPGSIMTFLKGVTAFDPNRVSYPCISMIRVLFGSTEKQKTSEEEQFFRHQEGTVIGQTGGFNASRFETLRWRYHASFRDKSRNGHGKVILDVSKLEFLSLKHMFPGKDAIHSIHRPFPQYCREVESYPLDDSSLESPLTVNHYLGSWERYSSRNDTRRSFQYYNKKARVDDGLDEGMTPWLSGFIDYVGYENATKLLGKDYLISDVVENN